MIEVDCREDANVMSDGTCRIERTTEPNLEQYPAFSGLMSSLDEERDPQIKKGGSMRVWLLLVDQMGVEQTQPVHDLRF